MPENQVETVSMAQEYESLRAEIARRSTVQQAVFVLNLTAVGAIVTLALKSGPNGAPASIDSSRSYFLTLLIPYIGFALARLWLDHHDQILRLGRYIRTALEPRGEASWETYLEAQGRSTRFNHYMFFGAYAVVFAGPSLAALGATIGHTHGWERWAMWASALALVLVNGYGWAIACRRPKERPISVARLRTMFEFRVRARLDWDRLANEPGVEVVEYYLDERAEYEGWWMPWYFREDSSGTRIEVDEEEGEPAISLLDCARLPGMAEGEWDPKARTVSEFDGEMAAAPATFDVCVYAVRGDDDRVFRIVLDGNHHLAAALRSARSFVARVFEIRNGPARDTTVLQDLGREWATDGRRRPE